jgi:hypothetical protein
MLARIAVVPLLDITPIRLRRDSNQRAADRDNDCNAEHINSLH